MVGRYVDWLVVRWLVGCRWVDWSVGPWVGGLIGWLYDETVDWLVVVRQDRRQGGWLGG